MPVIEANRLTVQRTRLLLAAAVMCSVAAERGAMQAANPADGPWSGWVQCQLTAQSTNPGQPYQHQQTHTWVLTGSTPLPTSTDAIKQYAATWQVTGQGTRQRGQSANAEQWTTEGQPMPDTITIRLTIDKTLRFAGAPQLRSVGTTTGTAMPYVEEWAFPVIEVPAAQSSISGSAPSATVPNFPGAPPATSSSGTCSWNFVRGGVAPPPPGLAPPSTLSRDTTGGAPAPTVAAVPGQVIVGPTPAQVLGAKPGQVIAGPNPAPTPIGTGREASPIAPSRTATPPDTATAAPVQATTTQGTQPGPTRQVPKQSPVLVKATSVRGVVTLQWSMTDVGQSGYFVYGPTFPSNGKAVGVTRSFNGYMAPCCTLTIPDAPVGSQAWLVVPYYQDFSTGSTSTAPFFDVSTGLRVTVAVTSWSIGPAPTNIKVQSSTPFNLVDNTCKVRIEVAWSPVPGAASYTVLADGKPVGTRIPVNSFFYWFREGQTRMSDPASSLILSALYEALASHQYSTSPEFQRGVGIQVVATFANPEIQGDGVSASVPYTFSTFPCSDGRSFPSQP